MSDKVATTGPRSNRGRQGERRALRRRGARGGAVFAAVLALTAIADRADAAPNARNVVIFNTVCAQCHELECSRRLAYSSSAPAAQARGHIENHAGPQDDAAIAELFGLLAYTKTHCDYVGPETPIPRDGEWSAAALAPLATADGKNWFVPLGALHAGDWAIELSAASSQEIKIEVVARQGVLAEAETEPGEGGVRLQFAVAESGAQDFLRLRSRAAIAFDRAVLREADVQTPAK